MSSFLAPRPASPPQHDGAREPLCDNCGTRLVGEYCHHCGQHDVDHLTSVREFFVHLADVVVGYDSRWLRTVTGLFARPGFLTAEYIAGRRARYLPPVQVYFISAALLFLAASYKPMVVFNPNSRVFSSAISTVSVRDTLAPADVARLQARGVSLELFAERFSNATTSHLSTFLVAIVPLFALVIAATFLTARRPFAHHLLFALHWTAFYLALLAILQPFPLARHTSLAVEYLLLGLPFWYLLLALRRAYGSGWVATALRGALLYSAFLATLAGWLQLVTEYTVHHL